MPFETVTVIGAGTMGHGIAQVCAMAGSTVRLYDLDQGRVDAGLGHIRKNLQKGVDRGKVSPEEQASTLALLSGHTDLAAACAESDLVVEAVPEVLELKRSLFAEVGALAPEGAVLGTNTSSLSVAKIAEAAPDPSRVIGTHFFNPVHIMKLLELVYHPTCGTDVISAVQEYGERIGKTCILVKDSPGFATSRLGVCLGMEAIRMLEEGVASAEDIDTAMVLGYRHPIGPLKLTDLVGLDVRMHIGEYLAEELGNDAFRAPELMKRMVAEGKLGKKSGEGFYRW